MDESNSGASGGLARQSCFLCKKQKRKCTRELPQCQLCRKSSRPCQYPSELPASVDEQQSPEQSETLSLFFLDTEAYRVLRTVAPPASDAIPIEFLELIGNPSDIEQDAELYFNSVHAIVPIISKIRFYQKLARESELRIDTVLLLLSMRLLRLPLEKNGPRPAFYFAVKRCAAYAEASAAFSNTVLQASILIAFYEVANGIYPAAYMSTGSCARMGYALGYHDRRVATQLLSIPKSWTELEEARRTWWAVFVLDRYTSIGIDNRPFCCGDAKGEELLPSDETLWESGEQAPTQSLAVSSTADVSASPFARTCQASHLLSLVVSHVNSKPADMTQFYLDGIQLHRVLDAFCLAVSIELASADNSLFGPLSSAVGICYSGLLALYDCHSCADVDDAAGIGIPEQLQLQEIALGGLKKLPALVSDLAVKLTSVVSSQGRAAASPFVADCFYATNRLCLLYFRETGRPDLLPAIEAIFGGLKAISGHWSCASRYLMILESVEKSDLL